jgi:hypothetical protein
MVKLGAPPVTWDNVWNICADLLMCFRLIEENVQIHELLAAQLSLLCDGDKLIGSKDLPVIDFLPFVEGSGPCGENNSNADGSDDAESEFDWTDESDKSL